MANFITRLFSRKTNTTSLRFRPAVDSLESRAVMSANITAEGNLLIQGTDANDAVLVSNGTDANGLTTIDVRTADANGILIKQSFSASQVTGVVKFVGAAGDDMFDASELATHRVTASGGRGSDSLTGGKRGDFLAGGGGSDTILGGAGNDTILGVGGNDFLLGEAGNDVINGGIGDDSIQGGAGDDQLFGDSGRDDLTGGDGNDRLEGGKDGYNDVCSGYAGADTFINEPYLVGCAGVTLNFDFNTDVFLADGDVVV